MSWLTTPSGQNKVIAVVADKDALRQWTHDVIACDWELKQITISEIELVKLHQDSERAEMCLYSMQGLFSANLPSGQPVLFRVR